MFITVNEVGSPQTESKNNKSWKTVTVKYTGDQGDKEKVFRSFGPDFKHASSLIEGQEYDVKLRKDGNFWVWDSVTPVAGGTSTTPRRTTNTTTGSTGYWDDKFTLDKERFAFDKEKQPLIVRQSCIGYAVEFVKHAKLSSMVTVDDVLEVASKFEAFVHSSGEEELKNMEIE